MANEDHESEAGASGATDDTAGQVSDIPAPTPQPVALPFELPGQSPLFHAEQADRYDRQRLIALYQEAFDCQLVVVIDNIFPYTITLFEDLIYDANPARDLHLLLNTFGGDGETAVRLARAAQARCREFTVIVPDIAKSAGTILALGAHKIIMGPVSDLGPVDPQFQLPDGSLVGAKDIIAAVDDATAKVQAAPDTYPLHASLLSDVTGLMVQQARAALARTDDLLVEALRANPDRTRDEFTALADTLHKPLIEQPRSHGAIFGLVEARAAGLPVIAADPRGPQWQVIWRLWAKYFALFQRVYEGERVSKLIPWPQQQ